MLVYMYTSFLSHLSLLVVSSGLSYFPLQPSYWLDWLPAYTTRATSHPTVQCSEEHSDGGSSEDDDSDEDSPLLTRGKVRRMDIDVCTLVVSCIMFPHTCLLFS